MYGPRIKFSEWTPASLKNSDPIRWNGPWVDADADAHAVVISETICVGPGAPGNTLSDSSWCHHRVIRSLN